MFVLVVEDSWSLNEEGRILGDRLGSEVVS